MTHAELASLKQAAPSAPRPDPCAPPPLEEILSRSLIPDSLTSEQLDQLLGDIYDADGMFNPATRDPKDTTTPDLPFEAKSGLAWIKEWDGLVAFMQASPYFFHSTGSPSETAPGRAPKTSRNKVKTSEGPKVKLDRYQGPAAQQAQKPEIPKRISILTSDAMDPLIFPEELVTSVSKKPTPKRHSDNFLSKLDTLAEQDAQVPGEENETDDNEPMEPEEEESDDNDYTMDYFDDGGEDWGADGDGGAGDDEPTF